MCILKIFSEQSCLDCCLKILLLLIYLLALGRAYILWVFFVLYDNKHFYNDDIKKDLIDGIWLHRRKNVLSRVVSRGLCTSDLRCSPAAPRPPTAATRLPTPVVPTTALGREATASGITSSKSIISFCTPSRLFFEVKHVPCGYHLDSFFL
jgi:hypothetical protein